MCSHSGMPGPIWLNFFLLAPSLAWGDFRSKKIRIPCPVFPEKSGKNRIIAIFIVLVVRLSWNFQERFFLLLGGQTKIFFQILHLKIRQNPVKTGKSHFNILPACDISFFMTRPWGGQFWHLFWNILKKNLPKKIWRIFWINLIFFPNFWHILTFFGVFGCIMIIWISRWNFPNFLSILGDFPTKFKFFDCFWLFF